MTKDTIKLEKVRKKKRLTIVEFTNRLPIQRSTYYGWITGMHTPDLYRMRECLQIAASL